MERTLLTMTLLIVMYSIVMTRVDGCNGGRRAAKRMAHAAEAMQRQITDLNQRLTKAVDMMQVDVKNTLSNLEVKMNKITNYLTEDLGPVIEKTLKDIDKNVEILVNEVTITLHKANIVLDKVSYCIDLITVLVFVVIGTVCRIVLTNVHLGLWTCIVVFVQMVSFICAPALLIAYVCRLCTGNDPNPHDMVKIIMVVLVFIPFVYIMQAIIPIVLYIFYIPFLVVYNLTLGPFCWLKKGNWKRSYMWIFLQSLGILVLLAAAWLLGFCIFGDNIIKASLFTYLVWLLIATGIRSCGPHRPRYYDKFREEVRQKRLNYYHD